MPDYGILQLATDTGDPTVARMTIFGDISRGGLFELLSGERDQSRTEALDVVDAIAALPASARAIEVHINSYGGDVSEGVAIYNALRESGRDVTTVCDGFACSIASVVFMAGSRRVMRPASLLMLHNPLYQRVGGNAKQLRKAADDLDVIAELSKTAYLTDTKMDADELDAVMAAETWVGPDKAMEWGLATEVTDPIAGDHPEQSVGEAVIDALMRDTPEAAMARMLPAVEERISRRIDAALDGIREQLDAERRAYEAAITGTEPKLEPEPETNPVSPVPCESAYRRLARRLGAKEDNQE